MIGFSDVLTEQVFGPLNDNQAQYVTDILESGQHLLSLVNDILDLAKIESGSTELQVGNVAISPPACRASRFRCFSERRQVRIGIRLVGQVDPELGMIQADSARLKQLLYNLLANALKFTQEGGEVRVTVSRCGESVVIAVSRYRRRHPPRSAGQNL